MRMKRTKIQKNCCNISTEDTNIAVQYNAQAANNYTQYVVDDPNGMMIQHDDGRGGGGVDGDSTDTRQRRNEK